MKVAQKFTVARPLAEVFAFFQDVPAVARCMPGAELTEDKGDGLYAGRVKVRLGPFGANFEGEARVTADPAAHSGHVEGKGVDRRGGSRTRMVMDYRLKPVGHGTEVTVDADVTLAGAIAQVGRTGLIQETANILVQDFVSALERELAPAATTDAAAPGTGTAASRASVTIPTAPPPALGAPSPADAPQASHQRRGPEVARAAEPAEAAAPAAVAKPRQFKETTSPKPLPRAIGGSVALRALWAWLKSLLRGLLGSNKKR